MTVEKEVQTFGGHQGLWQIYNGHKSDNPSLKLSVFTLQKNKYESRKASKEQLD